MKLFGKENDVIKRILNLILIIWFIGSIIISFRILTNVLFDYSKLNYKTFELDNCTDLVELNCEENYIYQTTQMKIDKNQDIEGLLFGLANTLIVGTSIYIINRKSMKK